MEVIALQALKASNPMDSKAEGKLMDCKEEQEEKASSPMEVTPDGSETELSFVQ